MINNDWTADSWNKPVDISEIRKIIKEEVKAELARSMPKDTRVAYANIKAIPIEYIQKWNNNYIADTMRNGRTIINQMLEDWEKENEQNKENIPQTD